MKLRAKESIVYQPISSRGDERLRNVWRLIKGVHYEMIERELRRGRFMQCHLPNEAQ